jgi:hypothetical protein
MQKRFSARSSGALESVGSGARPDSELSHVRTDEPRRKSSRSGNFRQGERTLQLGSPSGGVNFFNAICRLLMYEGSFSTRFSDLLISTDSFLCAETVSAGVGLRSSFSVSMDPLQLIKAMVFGTAIILNSRQVGCARSGKCLPSCCPTVRNVLSASDGPREQTARESDQVGECSDSFRFYWAFRFPYSKCDANMRKEYGN